MLSGYKLMWMIVLFDLPVVTKTERKNSNKFPKVLARPRLRHVPIIGLHALLRGEGTDASLYAASAIRAPAVRQCANYLHN